MNPLACRILTIVPFSLLILFLQGPVSIQAATYYVKSFMAGAFDDAGFEGNKIRTFKRGEEVEGPDLKVIFELADKLGMAISEITKYSFNEIIGLTNEMDIEEEEEEKLWDGTEAEQTGRIQPGQEQSESEGWLQVTWDGGQGWMRKSCLSPKPIKEKIFYQKPSENQNNEQGTHFRMRRYQIAVEKDLPRENRGKDFDLTNPDEESLKIMEKYASDEESSVKFLLSEDS